MNKRKLTAITVAMAIALIGIVSIQVYWVNNAYATIKERFFYELDNRLDKVIDRCGVLLTLHLINDIDKKGFAGMSNFESKEKVLSNIDSTEIMFKRYTVDIEEVLFEPSTEKQIRRSGKDQADGAGADSSQTGLSMNGHLESSTIAKDSQAVNFSELRRNEQGQLFRFISSFIHSPANNDPLLLQRIIDSLLNIEVAGMSPPLNFRYEILDGPADTFDTFLPGTGTGDPDGSHILKKIFPHAVSPNQMHLLVRVVDPLRAVLKKMRLVLITSVIFLIIIVYSFFYTLSSLVRQDLLNQMKSDFINNMTHELKTPITTIALATEALLDPNVEISPQNVHNMSKLIAKESNRLKQQVERVLQMDRMDRHKIDLRLEPMPLNDFLNEIIENVRIQVETKGGKLTSLLHANPDKVCIDALHIGNVIYNLIDNAIKYSTGPPEIFIHSYNGTDQVLVDVEDKGIGIPKELQPRIFERFYRVPTGNLHNVKGFGLGLAYVKEMMVQHQGDIKVISRVGKGSTFTLIFPIHKYCKNEES
ncbi:MAG: HAMP domain-containing histidine kinase [Bacteroidetes bacterium]|jgi:two-component system phosphate regulon sensor histidine kinase PhoR|nr:HAMP domain-containing histidine kinase [Bacteroidota bacterium]